MNPLGLPFEQFDHFGRFRFLELDKPVDVTSKIVNSGVPEIDGEIRSPFELIERLANSTHCEQVFVRYAFRFFMGATRLWETPRPCRMPIRPTSTTTEAWNLLFFPS